MQRLLVRQATSLELQEMLDWLHSTRDGDLFDKDVLNHESTFTLTAFDPSGRVAYLPVQQPLMIESLAIRPNMGKLHYGQALGRLTEHVVEEAYRRDAGEVYFLTKDPETVEFAKHHGFKDIADLGLKCLRMNLLETFGSADVQKA